MPKPALSALVLAAAIAAVSAPAGAVTPRDLLAALDAQARTVPGFSGFSADRGARLFGSTHGGEWSCQSCHTADPRQAGRHAKTGKTLAPLAPAANPDRFSDPARVEKWFRRNCNDVLNRSCTPVEQGDVLAWLISLK